VTDQHALIIDDKQTNIDVLVMLLNKEGLRHSALQSLRNLPQMLDNIDPVDIVFLDLEFPNGDGFQALQELRTVPRLQGVPIVAYSVHTSEVDDARRAGFDSFLGKPLSLQKFPQQLQQILRGEQVWEV
jgi:CheY-like chemotaxis protein